jgi:hypothetical protein
MGLPVLGLEKSNTLYGQTLYQNFTVSSTRKTGILPDSCKKLLLQNNYKIKYILPYFVFLITKFRFPFAYISTNWDTIESPYDSKSSSHPCSS